MTDDFEKRARDAADKYSANIRESLGEEFIAGAQWARAELTKPNIMDIARRLDGMAVANIDEPSAGDLERVLACNAKLKGDVIRLMDERAEMQAEIAETKIMAENLVVGASLKAVEKLREENERLKSQANPIGSDFNEHYKQELLAEIERLKLRIISLEGSLGHSVPSGVELPEVADNCLAKFIAKQRDALKAELGRANAALYEFRRFPHRLREEEQRAEIERLKAELDKAQEGERFYRREFESACERLKYRDEELERANLLLSDWRLKKVYAERDQLKAELAQEKEFLRTKERANKLLRGELERANAEVKRLHDKYDFQLLVQRNDELKLLAESETRKAEKYRVILSDLLYHYGKYEGLVMLMDIVDRARAALEEK